MTNRGATKLIELLRTFINSPCRTKADAEVLEAKLAEFEKEVAKPQKRKYHTLAWSLYSPNDSRDFSDELERLTQNGYIIESCGVNGTDLLRAWAILSKPKED